MRRGPRAFSKFGGLILVMTAAGVETGSKVAAKLFPLEKITAYLLDGNLMKTEYHELRDNLDLRTKLNLNMDLNPEQKSILSDFEQIQELRKQKLMRREMDTFKRSTFCEFHEIFK